MAQVVYLEKSQGNKNSPYLVMQTYEYGTGKEYKTLTSAIKQAQKDFKREAKNSFNESFKYIGIRNAFRISQNLSEGILIHNQVEINS